MLIIAPCPPLPQDPTDFAGVVRDQVRAPAGHQKHIELVHGVLDWKAFFQPLGLHVHGHTRTHRMREAGIDAVHCFRFVRHDHCGRPGGWQWPSDSIGDHAGDVILFAKMHMASEDLSERMVFCRNEAFHGLPVAPVPVPLLRADAQTAKELEKTAVAVQRPPWLLARAAAYLRSLIVEPPLPEPPSVGWLWAPAAGPGPEWAGAVAPSEFRGVGEDKTPGALEVEDRLIGKRRRTSEPATPPAVAALAGDRVAALAVGSSGAAKAPPPPKAVVPAKVKAVPKAAKAPPPAVSKAKATAAKAAAPLCPGLGCGKCRRSPNGCRECKRRNGWFEVSPGKWEHRL